MAAAGGGGTVLPHLDDIHVLRWRERLRAGFWVVPSAFVLGALLLSLVTLWLDEHVIEDLPGGFSGGPDNARDVLSTISSSMITFTALVFSITIVVLQLTSSQFSPRVLRTFLRDRSTQVSLGVFVATFAYSLLVLRAVRSDEDVFVPALSVALAFVLVLVSLAVFVHYIHHIAQSIQVSSIIAAVAAETRETIERMYPPGASVVAAAKPAGAPTSVVRSDRTPGVILGYDDDRLIALATANDCTLVMVPAVGDFVPEGATLFQIHGTCAAGDEEIAACVALGRERTMHQDVAFGFRQLVDIAERALSPAINDPTTAVQCLDHIHDFLRRLAARGFPSGCYVDEQGVLRLAVVSATWEDYVSLAFDEVRQYGNESVQVARRLRATLEDLLGFAPPERRAPLLRELRLLDLSISRSFPDIEDRQSAGHPDTQGLGS